MVSYFNDIFAPLDLSSSVSVFGDFIMRVAAGGCVVEGSVRDLVDWGAVAEF